MLFFIFSNRKNAKFESKGQRYEMGDFVIKIGSVVLGANTSFKGILVEVSEPRFFLLLNRKLK